MRYAGISTYQFIPYYASAIHRQTHTRILKPFEDSLRTGLKVDIARSLVSGIAWNHLVILDNTVHPGSTDRLTLSRLWPQPSADTLTDNH